MTSDILSVARRAAFRACDVCLAVLASAPGTPEAMAKVGKEPVTIADYGSQAVILAEVAACFPDHAVVAEEGAAHLLAEAGDDGARRIVEIVGAVIGRPTTLEEVAGWIDHHGGPSAYTWVIDPIDGTKGFLRRQQFAVAVGVLRDLEVYAGVLGCPHFDVDPDDPSAGRGVVFTAVAGGGAFMEPLAGGDPIRVSVSEVADPSGVRVLGSVESAHGDPALVKAIIADAGLGGGMVRIDSQVKYGAVAAGLAEVYIRPRSRPDYRENIWDHAAGVAVVTEAGGRVTDLDGKPLDFSKGPKLVDNRGVLATNGIVHDLILESLARVEAG
ncbi:MAG: 3'(2'),5'-bisphosphate nucleotidase [Actinobacteria bacterium]|nr:3'(2'),5'-bisphosphate nucleotidase [Actinomycetota bacterium]MBU1492849.1 3'(2'),5'-bisphosphate nucleotidase [Actinomycetota bacterium]